MMITAALPWWNELPEDLDRCVRALANIADRVVALDGSYRRYPEATIKSSKAEVSAIKKAAKSVGLECQVVQPDRMWAGQVEKRTELLRLASKDSNWIVTVDADHVVNGNREAVREEISQHNDCRCLDVFDANYFTPDNPGIPGMEIAPGKWHLNQRGIPTRIAHVWKVYPEMRVERFHWWYKAVKDGQPIWLWGGGEEARMPVTHGLLQSGYWVDHMCLYRTPDQIKRSRAFLNDRVKVVELTGQEDDVEGLPAPEWDFITMPE